MEMTDSEVKLARIIWKSEPLKSSLLVTLCESELSWKKSTTYTMLKRIEEKGIVKNEKGLIQSLMNEEEYYSWKSENIIHKDFFGSLPHFIAAFTKRKRLSGEEMEEIRAIIEKGHKEE